MKSASSNVGLYVHIPYCQKKCPYCNFYSVPIDSANPNTLIDALFAELEMIGVTEPVKTLYIGGGSPTCLRHDVLTEFVSALNTKFGPVEEFTVECNPAQADERLFQVLRLHGVNRLSIGAQSFHVDELKTLGRIHAPKQIAEAVRMAKAAGFDNIGLDLIFGVPSSTIDAWKHSLEYVIELDVQHISAYSLTIEENTPFGRAIKQGILSPVDEQTDRAMYEAARQVLKDAGFVQYEISNFAKPGFECQHNLRYWKNWPVIGIGPAAAAWHNGKRTVNVADIAAYIQKIQNGDFAYAEEHKPTPEQIASETAVLGLRMLEGIDLFEYERQTDFELFTLFGNAINKHCFDGLLECTADDHCRLTEKGLSYADTVAQDFIL
jgi:oxygen-independent coproporphyrinogen III oxidase